MNNTLQSVAIVTGASSGIGVGVTQALLEHWRVVATGPISPHAREQKTDANDGSSGRIRT
jgi:NAD(P)-dependent dehydrogenase (short-subunit alcohol dehydrogenase family)